MQHAADAAQVTGAERHEQPSVQDPAPLPTLTAPHADAEALLRSTLDALSAHVAVLDGTGTILAVNQSWRAFADSSGYSGRDHGVGTNYLSICESGAESSHEADQTARALRDIMAGTRRRFRMEYPCESPDGLRWFQVRITRPDAQTSRIVVAHEDITEVKRAQQALNRLSARLIQLQDEERRSIARELHDTTAQNLLAITLNATRLRDPSRNPDGASRILGEIIALGEQSLQEVRTLSYLLHPPLLDEMGLAAALRWLAKGFSERSGVKVETRISEDGAELSADAATTLFRVAQEALSNVHRHSGSAWARLSLRRSGGMLRLEVSDGGSGLASSLASEGPGKLHNLGVGISGMRVRLEQLAGKLEIESGPAGTRVHAFVPIASAKPAEIE